jgi:pyruvate/2-oxoglutarate dehydrogenase complex dihydrolipoamide acyltransferase (E2) component
MSDKVVLPKFDLPGDRTHPAVKVLWAAVSVFLLCLLALGGALWHQHSLQLAAEKRQSDLVAARTAEANAAAEAAKARVAEAAAKVAAAEQAKAAEKAEKLAAKNAVASAGTADGGKAGSGHHGARHHGSTKGGSKALAKATTADDKKGAAKQPAGSKRDDAAIDKLLASFK